MSAKQILAIYWYLELTTRLYPMPLNDIQHEQVSWIQNVWHQ
jgi:hypothetical protein